MNFPTFAEVLCGAGGGTRTHTRLPSPDFESDKECAIVRDAALRSAFTGLFASLSGMVRDHVRPDCNQNSHQYHLDEAWLQKGSIVVPQLRDCVGEITGEPLLGASLQADRGRNADREQAFDRDVVST